MDFYIKYNLIILILYNLNIKLMYYINFHLDNYCKYNNIIINYMEFIKMDF